MKVMHTFLHFWGKTPLPVITGADPELHAFHHCLVFQFGLIDIVGGPAVGLPPKGIGSEADAGAGGAERLHDIEGQAPGIKVEHQVGKEPEIVGVNAAAVIGVAFGDIEAGFPFSGNANL